MHARALHVCTKVHRISIATMHSTLTRRANRTFASNERRINTNITSKLRAAQEIVYTACVHRRMGFRLDETKNAVSLWIEKDRNTFKFKS